MTGPEEVIDPNEKIVAGITSFGTNGNCAGIGGVYRIDKEDDLVWLNSFGFDTPDEPTVECDGLPRKKCMKSGCHYDQDTKTCTNDVEVEELKTRVDNAHPTQVEHNSGSSRSMISVCALTFMFVGYLNA